MSTDTNLNIDVVQLIKSVFGSNKERNDLAVGIRNDTGKELHVNYYVEHGSIKEVSSSSKILPEELWECGVNAKGAGSNIGFSLTMSNGAAFAIMAATPSNKQNYFKISHNKNGYKSAKVAWNGANKNDKHYSGDGYYEDDYNDHHMEISITGTSPAACTIVISE
ncbi:hypothetical protein [Shewanella nanhaiensis]|uniref:Uncharacterized protein n=1 Tax=Shewanella nanhaiensis TaxID=2864872 RepID=A0ABS7E3B0_9GAMM|nr:hypothetical protein [Shewanella nanhaiensis]MBW8184127.1 hypothetical protein [Shewanella nanhaiensis]